VLAPHTTDARSGRMPPDPLSGFESAAVPDAGVLLAWARRLAAAEGEVHAVGLAVRAAAAEAASPDPVGEALTQLAERTAAEVAALGQRVARAARLLAAEAMRSAQ
jgi:hypothetical protein